MTKPTSTAIVCFLLTLLILGVAAYLRLHQLSERPVHFDEATGARIVGYDLEQKRDFDPKHFHGPLLSSITVPYVRQLGQTTWQSLTITPLRSITAWAGILTVVTCLFFPARWSIKLSAAALVCTSPLLVYYSRMYIHESLFVFTGILSLWALAQFCRSRHLCWAIMLGLAVGLMAATRETVVVALFSWILSGLLAWFSLAGKGSWRERMAAALDGLKKERWSLVAGVATCLLTIYLIYSHFGQNHRGFLDFFSTFFVYETTPGHEKPWDYYLQLLVIPKSSLGVIWTEAAVLLLAVIGYFCSPTGRPRTVCRFVLNSGLILLLVFSLISYKTPWLICLAWLHVCIAAAFGLSGITHFIPEKSRLLTGLMMIALLSWQTLQSTRAVFQWPSDARNPYAYVPTSPDLLKMTHWLQQLSQDYPPLKIGPHAVIGTGYWPLPWYLRDLGEVGYYPDPKQATHLPQAPLIFTTREIPESVEKTHQWLPRGLRHEVPLWLGIRNDIWQAYQQHE